MSTLLTARGIWAKHIEAFKAGKLNIKAQDPVKLEKPTKEEMEKYLTEGGISKYLFHLCFFNTTTIFSGIATTVLNEGQGWMPKAQEDRTRKKFLEVLAANFPNIKAK